MVQPFKIKFVEPGEKVRFSKIAVKILSGFNIDPNREYTIEEIDDTLFDGFYIYQFVKLREFDNPFTTAWLDLPHSNISLEEIEKTMPELIKKLEETEKCVAGAIKKVIEDKLRSFFSNL